MGVQIHVRVSHISNTQIYFRNRRCLCLEHSTVDQFIIKGSNAHIHVLATQAR